MTKKNKNHFSWQKGVHIKEDVQPITSDYDLQRVENCLLTQTGEAGQRNYTLFQVGKATMLRISDVLKLKKSDVYDNSGNVKERVYTADQKTKKLNKPYLTPVAKDLAVYREWLKKFQHSHHSIKHLGVFDSPWLFPSIKNPEKPIGRKTYWYIMKEVGRKTKIGSLGTHTMRKTGAYRTFNQLRNSDSEWERNNALTMTMRFLNHSSEKQTLDYLGLTQERNDHVLRKIDFG